MIAARPHGVLGLSPFHTLFLSNHHCHKRLTTCTCSLSFRLNTCRNSSLGGGLLANTPLIPSKFISFQTRFTYLHIRNKWPPSSFSLPHITRFVCMLKSTVHSATQELMNKILKYRGTNQKTSETRVFIFNLWASLMHALI
jgi:hypothetical protein